MSVESRIRQLDKVFGHWKVEEYIGSGSGGKTAVFRLIHGTSDTDVSALKVINLISVHGNFNTFSESRKKEYEAAREACSSNAKTEVDLMIELRGNTNIVDYLDHTFLDWSDENEFGRDLLIRMEYLKDLRKEIQDRDYFCENEVLKVGRDICTALGLCHSKNILHRDIKPENIFLNKDGNYKLGDFGIARVLDACPSAVASTGIGTYQYWPAEQTTGRYDKRVDIYSLGLVLYELCNENKLPFARSTYVTTSEVTTRLRAIRLPKPQNARSPLATVILKACAFEPNERYQNVVEFLQALNRVEQKYRRLNQNKPIPLSEGRKQQREENDSVEEMIKNSDYNTMPAHVDIKRKSEQRKVNPERNDDDSPQKTVEHNPKPGTTSGSRKYKIGMLLLTILLVLCAGALAIVLLGERLPKKGSEESVDEQVDVTATEKIVTYEDSEWSEWFDYLPTNISAEEHEIEERTLYSRCDLETKTSTEQSTMDGWELFDTVEANGELGPWSEWSAEKVVSSETNEVETQIRYRYRSKETTTGTTPNKNGWFLYDTSYTWGDYGPWSDWTVTAVSNSDSRKIETKKQYSYRDVSYTTDYTAYGSWSSWSFERQNTDDLTKEESRTVWGYYYYTCPSCGTHMHGWGITCPTWAGGCGNAYIPEDAWTQVYSTISWDDVGLGDWHGTGKYYTYIDNELVFKWPDGGMRTQYRYASRSTQRIANHGNWSDWEDTVYYSSSNQEVQTRIVYRFCDRTQIPTYHFYRWGNWSDWSMNKVSASDNCQVEDTTFYRYREQMKTTTYYFSRWTDWSEFSTDIQVPSENVKVQTKTQYRFKVKE